MKYFKVLDSSDLKKVAGEMINIQTGREYFINGVLQTQNIKKYNIYMIGDIEYEIHPTVGHILSFSTSDQRNDIIRYYNSLIRMLYHKNITVPVAIGGTTQYQIITEDVPIEKFAVEFHITNTEILHDTLLQSNKHFNWYFSNENTRDSYTKISEYYNIPKHYDTPYVNFTLIDNNILSLSTIICDTKYLDLEDGYRNIDLPDIKHYTAYLKGNIAYDYMYIHPVEGIHNSIASNFIEPSLFERSLKHYCLLSNPVHWIKWEDVDYKVKTNCGMKWYEQLKWRNSKVISINDESVSNVVSSVVSNVNGKVDSQDNTDSKLVSSVVSNVNGNVDSQDNTDNKAASNVDSQDNRSRENERDPRCFITDIPIYEDCYVFDIYSQMVEVEVDIKKLTDELKNGSVIVRPERKLTKRSVPIKSDNIEEKNLIINIYPKKKGETADRKMVLIKRKVYYDTPFRILIAPYTYHRYLFLDPHTQGSMGLFRELTESEVIMYRTFCPRLAVDVIDRLNQPDIYKNFLKAFHSGSSLNSSDHITSRLDDKIYTVWKRFIPWKAITGIDNTNEKHAINNL